MHPYVLRKLLLRVMLAFPAPAALDRFLRLYVHTRAGENFGDMTLNGEVRFLEAHGPACRVLFDVGAHEGVWTGHALRVNPRARIHCFEPIQTHYQRLLARGFPAQVICNPIGLSDADSTSQIFTKSLSLYDRRGPGPNGAADARSEPIRLTTLQAYCARADVAEIDLLKIDTEGHDLAVLRGAGPMIREGRIRRVQFEYGPPNLYARVFLRDVFAFFEGLPYTMYQIMPRRLAKVSGYDLRLENFHYKNFAALHDSVRA